MMDYNNFMVKISNKLDNFPVYGGDYIIEFKARSNSRDKYERFIEIITLDPQNDTLIWLNDWREGHDDFILRSSRKALINGEYSFKDPSGRSQLYNTLITAEYALQTLILLRDSIKEVNNNGT